MSTLVIDPVHWTADRLANFDHDALHELTLKVAGTHHAYQLVLGRCLLAVQRNKLYQRFGCSGAVHYGVLVLGLKTQKARALRWVAQKLEALPLLSLALQSGEVSYSKVREVVRKATAETEELWLELCRNRTYRQIEALVRHTPKGGLPGDLPEESEKEPALCDLRLSLGPTARAVVDRGLQAYSLKAGRPVPLAEAVEALFAGLLEKESDELEALAKAQKEARKDRLAERARRNPLVREARRVAQAMGLGQEEAGETGGLEGDLPLAQMAELLLATATALIGPREEELPAREISKPPSGEGQAAELSARSARRAEAAEQPAREIFQPTTGDGEGAHIESLARGAQAEDIAGGAQAECPARGAQAECPARGARRGSEEPAEDPARDICWQNPRLHFNEEARLPTPAQRREILRRDGYCCSTPGCPNHLWLELHHVVPYSEKGKTLPANLITLCSRCHKNAHEGRMTISGQDGAVEFRDGHGNDLARQHDLSVACWLNFRIGWRGGEEDSHYHRALAAGKAASASGKEKTHCCVEP
jgi:hypothetical protein